MDVLYLAAGNIPFPRQAGNIRLAVPFKMVAPIVQSFYTLGSLGFSPSVPLVQPVDIACPPFRQTADTDELLHVAPDRTWIANFGSRTRGTPHSVDGAAQLFGRHIDQTRPLGDSVC